MRNKSITSLISFLLFALVLNCSNSYAQDKDDYPIDQKTNKITYQGEGKVNSPKNILFKNALQFIAAENYEREISSKTKIRKAYLNIQPVPKSISYQDAELGKVFGKGFYEFEYRGKDRFVMSFNYKIYVQDSSYKYVFTDFVVQEYVTAGKSYGKSYMTGSTASFNSDARILSFPLEEFIDRRRYEQSSSDIFLDDIHNTIRQLKTAMKGNL